MQTAAAEEAAPLSLLLHPPSLEETTALLVFYWANRELVRGCFSRCNYMYSDRLKLVHQVA